MNQFPLAPQEVARRGQEIYQAKLKTLLEADHFGKYVAIDVETGDHFVGNSLEEALTAASERYPGKIFHSVKVGSKGVFEVSGLGAHIDQPRWLSG